MTGAAFQDFYPDDVAHCYGCGRLNPAGHRFRSFWDGGETVCRFTPSPEQTSLPGYVYGGLLASLVDCHGTGSAAAAAYRAEGRPMDSAPAIRFLTASLQVDYLAPTPLGVELEARGVIEEVKGRKVVVAIRVLAAGVEAVRGRVVAVRAPDDLLERLRPA